jgi:hypothetical protein
MTEFYDYIAGWLDSDLYQLAVEWMALFVKEMTLATIEWTTLAVIFAWDVAQQIMEDIGFSEFIAGMYAGFDSQLMNVLLWFRIPEVVSITVNAYVTKYVMRWIPGVGF